MRFVRLRRVWALCLCLLLVTGLCACTQSPASGGGSGTSSASGGSAGASGSSDAGSSTPADGPISDSTPEELIHFAETCRKNGEYFASLLLDESTDFWFGNAGAALSSLRLCVERVLWLRGEGESFASLTEGSRCTDWDQIADMAWGSPFPLYFEGLIYALQGKDEEAALRFSYACAMDAFPESGLNFWYLRDEPIETLYALRDRLREQEELVYSQWEPVPSGLARNYDMGFAQNLQVKILELDDAEKYEEALPYCRRLVQMEPFGATGWSVSVILAMEADEPVQAALWLVEGMAYCPEDETLQQLRDGMADLVAQLEGEAG